MKIQYFAGVLLALVALTAHSFDRPFPANAKRGKMSIVLYPTINIDGQARKLSPGAKIWNQDNLIQMPTSLGSDSYLVNYTENGDGDIDRVWMLTAEEAAKPPVRQIITNTQ
jgi:hypothetical protein